MNPELAQFDIFEIKLILNPASARNIPTQCKFSVRATFLPVNGVVPYPEYTFTSENWREIPNFMANRNEVLENILDRISKFKNLKDFEKARQKQVDDFITQQRGL